MPRPVIISEPMGGGQWLTPQPKMARLVPH